MMNDAMVVISFGVGYVAAGLMVLSVFGASNMRPQMKLVPIKVRSRRP